jgi:hypothetical protein
MEVYCSIGRSPQWAVVPVEEEEEEEEEHIYLTNKHSNLTVITITGYLHMLFLFDINLFFRINPYPANVENMVSS